MNTRGSNNTVLGWRMRLLVSAILGLHAILLALSAWLHSPVFNEVGHLPAGLSHLQMGRFDLYRVNPPLVRMIAAIPVLFAAPKTDWKHYTDEIVGRPERRVATDFLIANGSRSFWLFTLGRWACIPFSLVGGYICFRWAYELYGDLSGLLSAALWCFCPTILGNAALIMPDVPSAAFGIAACYTFWNWLKQPTWRSTIISGAILGLAELTKTTLIAFFPLWPIMWIAYRIAEHKRMQPRDWLREVSMLVLRMAIGLYVINLGYVFEGSCIPLSEYRFRSRALTGFANPEDLPVSGANRFQGSWLGSVPVPLPKNYVQGIDAQKADFEVGMKSYLHGVWQDHGWWYFYLYASTIKIPLGTWAVMLAALGVTIWNKKYSGAWRDEMILLVPLAAIGLLVSSQVGFSIHFRYILPLFPFAFIWASKTARALTFGNFKLACVVGLSTCLSLGSSLWIFPHSLSYFNEVVGGPKYGHLHLLNSNVAWGQDLLFLKRWYDAHPQARPLHLAALGFLDPRLAGIDFVVPPPGPRSREVNIGDAAPESLGPQPGWYAVDLNFLHGARELASGIDERPIRITDDLGFSYFLRFEPVGHAGWSICIYHITLDEANNVRQQLALPPLAGPVDSRDAQEAIRNDAR